MSKRANVDTTLDDQPTRYNDDETHTNGIVNLCPICICTALPTAQSKVTPEGKHVMHQQMRQK